MLTMKQGIMLSAIIGKIGLKVPDTVKTQEQLGIEMTVQILSNAYKAEKEIYAFVANVKGCTVKEAEEVDLAELIPELMGDASVRDFLSSAVASQAQN